MALYIASLNSGSNGNCYYIGNNTEAVLIDVGISCREVEKRLKQLDLQVKKIKAIFVSHEHGDHIKGVTSFANKHKLPVYITDATAKQGVHLIRHLSKSFSANIPVTVGELSVTAFPKYHDAVDPHSFILNYSGTTVGVFTDIGKVCKEVIDNFKQCHAVFLEANYDETMLENGHYPLHLKNRIRGGNGHLSNKQALQLFTNHKPAFLSHLILSHLSKENNSPEIVENLFASYAGETAIHIASRNQASSVFSISGKEQTTLLQVQHPVQLNLFA